MPWSMQIVSPHTPDNYVRIHSSAEDIASAWNNYMHFCDNCEDRAANWECGFHKREICEKKRTAQLNAFLDSIDTRLFILVVSESLFRKVRDIILIDGYCIDDAPVESVDISPFIAQYYIHHAQKPDDAFYAYKGRHHAIQAYQDIKDTR